MRSKHIVLVYHVPAQAITCGNFLEAENINFMVTFFYGFNEVEERIPLWEDLLL